MYKSENGDVKVSFTLQNSCPEDVEIFWHGYDGALTSYGQVGANAGKPMESFATHPWSAKSVSGVPVMVHMKPVWVPEAGDNGQTIYITA